MTTTAVTLKVVTDQVQPEHVVVGRFIHGPPMQLVNPSAVSDAHENGRDEQQEQEKLKTVLYQNTEERRNFQRILQIEDNEIECVARNYGDASFRLNHYNYAVGVFSQKTKTLRMIPVQHIYDIHTHVKALRNDPDESKDSMYDYSNNDESIRIVDKTQTERAQEFMTAHRAFVDNFASKKRKSAVASRESNKVVIQEDVKTVLDAAIEENKHQMMDEDEDDPNKRVLLNEKELMQQTKSTLLPKYDATTINVSEVYPIQHILPKDEFQSLTNPAKQLLFWMKKREDLQNHQQELSSFVYARIPLLQAVQPYQKQLEKAVLLAYIHCLLAFRRPARANPTRAVAGLPEFVNEVIKERILNDFSTPQQVSGSGNDGKSQSPEIRRVHGSDMERKLLCYIVILSLTVCDFRLGEDDLFTLCTDMKLTKSGLVNVCRGVGCSGDSKHIVLKAPLTFPSFGKGKGKKR